MKKIIHVVAGGPKSLIPNLTQYKNENIVWVGVDRGVHYLIDSAVTPHIAVGDFDSITEDEWTVIAKSAPEIRRYHPEKDETDMELALMWAIEQNPDEINIFGATGGRLDHFMANALMLAPFKEQYPSIQMKLIDLHNLISIHYPGSHEVKSDARKKYVSFIPLSHDVTGLTLKGFKYTLTNKQILFGSSLCISNELIQQKGTFSFQKGILMMIRSKD